MRKYFLILLTLVLLMSGCNIKSSMQIEEWNLVGETKHFIYYSHAENELDKEQLKNALKRLENFWEEVAPLWDFPTDIKIKYYKFKDKEQLKKLTNYNVTGKALIGENTIYSIYDSDAHEVSHIISTYSIASNHKTKVKVSNFWLEGTAMYYTWPWVYYGDETDIKLSIGFMQGQSVNYNSQQILMNNQIPDIELFIYGNKEFDKIDEFSGYNIAGSFITYLLGSEQTQNEKIEIFHQFLQKINDSDSLNEVKSEFKAYFGKDFETAIKDWQSYIRN